MLEPGKVLGERYEIVKKIGAGGMSIVYLAKCNKLQRYVAIKVLRAEFATDEAFVKKFRAEAFSAGSLSHPNIVGIYDVGVEEQEHYIVMEYVEGQTLKEVIEMNGALAPNVALDYGSQIVSALRHAHKKQIIHRDIKPQNILVTHDGVLKVADFGIARAVDSSTIVATGNAIGSVHYFSPEQAKGKYVNETSDLYSAGIVLFEMVTGHLPFQADSHVTVALKHINEEIPKPSMFVPDLWVGLEQIILKATNKKQELRYQNADAMLEDMKKIAANPYATIDTTPEESIDQTILLSEVQTNFIRQNERPAAQIPPTPTPIPPVPKVEQPESTVQLAQDFYDEDEDEEEEEVSTLYKVLVSLGGVLATIVVLGIVAVAAIFFMPSMGNDKYIAVPDFYGKTLDVATKEAADKKLKIKQVSEEQSDEVDPGTILSQSPKREELVKPGAVIEVVVATQKEVTKKKVIDVIGIDVGDAQRDLESAGFYGMPQPEYHDTFEIGKVITQDPLPGEMLAEGGIVKLVVSRGPKVELVKVPNLDGKTEADAKLALNNVGLKAGKVTPVAHGTIPAGYVVSQTVRPDTDIEKGATVDFEVSTGPEETTPTPEVPEGETGGEVPEGETEGEGEGTSQEVTVTKIIREPDLGKDEYHVMILLEDVNGSKPVFDQVVKKAQFPLPVQITGSGEGTLITFFDGQEYYRDPVEFKEVTQ
ncbi:MAG: Stk1 family PASTA domain-containing Ser/Thr kinase [Cellulosilyticaceae bacterium]